MHTLNALLLFLSSNALQLDVTVEDGLVSIALDKRVYLKTVDVVIGSSKLSDNSAKLKCTKHILGSDALGDYEGYEMEFTPDMIGTVRWYNDSVVFTQHFPQGAAGRTPAGRLSRTAFPAFDRSNEMKSFSYYGYFPQMISGTLADFEAIEQGGVPIVAYDEAGAAVVSSLDRHKASQSDATTEWVGFGIKSSASRIPANWTQSWIVSVGSGVKSAMDAWGGHLLRYHGAKNELRDNMYRDDVHGKIGFWTDNGGYYHYSPGPSGELYETSLPRVKAYHDDIGVPFGHWQFDSWFYPKDGPVDAQGGGGGGAVINWTADKEIFPSGMESINRALGGLPMVMHNRQWSVVSAYINESSANVEWATTGNAPDGCAAPKDPHAFFEWFFRQQEGWGLAMYEQDWMNKEYDCADALRTNISLADDWLAGMAAGVQASARTQQYCMPYAPDILSAAAFPAVTNARASDDYFHGAVGRENWKIGATSLLYSSLGILPFKDGFYSSSSLQPGGANDGPETNPDREIIIATLSGGMVGPMDGLGFLNKSRVMASCRNDGTVLKPDRPLHISEACFFPLKQAFGRKLPESCYVYETYSDVSEDCRVHYVFLADTTTLARRMLDTKEDEPSSYLVYNWYTGQILRLDGDDEVELEPGYEGHVYAIVSPLVDNFAFFGDVSKYATASTKRFSILPPDNKREDGVVIDRFPRVAIDGLQGERVSVCASAEDAVLRCTSRSFDRDEEHLFYGSEIEFR